VVVAAGRKEGKKEGTEDGWVGDVLLLCLELGKERVMERESGSWFGGWGVGLMFSRHFLKVLYRIGSGRCGFGFGFILRCDMSKIGIMVNERYDDDGLCRSTSSGKNGVGGLFGALGMFTGC
jgi:hypothetical protein